MHSIDVFLRSRLPGDFALIAIPILILVAKLVGLALVDRFDCARYLETLRSCGAAVAALLISCAVATIGSPISRRSQKHSLSMVPCLPISVRAGT
jgi:hypothetical protein